MSLLRTLIRPDREENAERAEVARAANLLQIGEFQLLQLAFREWFGRDIPPGETDRLFGAYMFHNQVPHWARHFARRIIGLDAAGLLDDRDPAYHRYDPNFRPVDPESVHKFCTVALFVAMFLGGTFWVTHFSAERTSQLFPPYVSDRDIGNVKPGPPR